MVKSHDQELAAAAAAAKLRKRKPYHGQTSLKAKGLRATRRQVARLQNRCVGIMEALELYGVDHPEMMMAGLEALDCLITLSPAEATVALDKAGAGRRLTKLLSRHARLPLQMLIQNVEERVATELARKQKIEEAKQARLEAEEVGRRLAEEADVASRQWNRRLERQAAGLDPDDDEDDQAAEEAAGELASKRARAESEAADDDEEEADGDEEGENESRFSEFTPDERAQVEREEVHTLGLELLYRVSHKGKRPPIYVGRGNDGLAAGLSQVEICVPRKPKVEITSAMFKWDGMVGTAIAAAAKRQRADTETVEEKREKALAAKQAAEAKAAEEQEAAERCVSS